jgi:SepF-like predicted cell division protein (DUF552 family)
MDNNTLIAELRDWAEVQGAGSLGNILNLAADRIEEMDERISIVSEQLDNTGAEFDAMLQEIGVREA